MVLVDTSIWIDHFRNCNDQLVELLNDGEVFCHPFIIGELACGNLKNRKEILTALQALPQSSIIEHNEIMIFIEKNNIISKGLGYIDVAILASSLVTGSPLWTLDLKLNDIAIKFDINHSI
ncbi:type II toxin-antitoxin system VapC family toxin [bacterium]|nr:type II toxin-antitoxin system VapC family toxin [bacterium]